MYFQPDFYINYDESYNYDFYHYDSYIDEIDFDDEENNFGRDYDETYYNSDEE